jgi:uncharacterized membrane protein affecting hemolysin expression
MIHRPDDGEWHLDKKVPIALIVTLLLQGGIVMWWIGSSSQRLDQNERHVTALTPQVTATAEKIIRVETKLEAIGEAITEIKNLIRQGPRRGDQ